MKIALLIKEFVPTRGGLERYSYTLATTLVTLGHELHVWSMRFAERIPAAIHCHPVAQPAWCPWTAPLNAVRKMREAVQHHGCDVLLALSPFYPADVYRSADGVQAHWMRIKYGNALLRFCAQSQPRRMAINAIERCLYRPQNCKTIITNSCMVKNLILRYYQFPPDRIHVVYNGVDGQVFHPGSEEGRLDWRKQWQIPTDKMVVLFVANDWRRKGLDFLMDGARHDLQSGKALLVVVGRGNIGKWQKIAARLHISQGVVFAGATPQVGEWYRAADVLVLPTCYDPFANVTLEAMSSGLPVITTADNGAAELIGNGHSGYVLSQATGKRSWHGYDSEELAAYLSALHCPDTRRCLGAKALATAQQFTLSRNAEATVAVCQSAIR
jgi:UDP-glucose:(heptosyl)LPS alpha-1,3-glucosyltransferase